MKAKMPLTVCFLQRIPVLQSQDWFTMCVKTSPKVGKLFLFHFCDIMTFSAHIYLCFTDVIFIGNYAFTIQATDKENDPLTYTLTGPNAGYFTVERTTGRVSIRRELNREVWCCESRGPKVFTFFILILYVF